MNSQLNRIFYGLLAKHKIEKAMAVLCASNGRTERSSELTDVEAGWFIREGYLKMIAKSELLKIDKADALRKRLIATAYSMGRDTEWVKEWVQKRSKKKLNDVSERELVVLRIVLEKIRSHEIEKVVVNDK